MAATHTSVSLETPAVAEEPSVSQHGEMPFIRLLIIGCGLGLLSLLLIRLWQGQWWFPVGLDATTPEFGTYWLGLLYVEWLAIIGAGLIGYFAYRKPCPVCTVQKARSGRLDPEHELHHIGTLWTTVAIAAMFGFGVSYFAEQDASWHQIVVRDTAFTPSHIPLFFYTFPMLLIMTGVSSWYAYQRLHHLYVGENGRGIPISYLLFPAGAWVLFANVAFNELGHSSWITEELFVQPYHFPFAWATYFFFSGFALLFKTVPRMYDNLLAMSRAKAA